MIPESVSPFGKFEIEDELTEEPSASGPGEYSIRIEMTPNERTANATEIGFIQTVRRGRTPGAWSTGPNDFNMDAERSERTVQDPTQAWSIDRSDSRELRTPFYGQERTAAGGNADRFNARRGRFGGANPWIFDGVGIRHPQHATEFISCAVCQTPVAGAPNERGRSYGCITWGFVYDDARDPKFVAETPAFSIQTGWTDWNDRSRATNRAVDRWNAMNQVDDAGNPVPVGPAATDIAPAPRVQGLPPARLRGEGPVELRREEGGRLVLGGNLLYGRPGLGAFISVIRRSVRRLDYDGVEKFMTEVLYGSTIGWLPEAELEFPDVPRPM